MYFFQSCPGLTSKLVRKYLPKSVATVQGHLNQARKIQYQHKSQSQWIPERQKLVFSLQQSGMQEEYIHIKQVGFQSHSEWE